jgi:Cu+-exporting ATPase
VPSKRTLIQHKTPSSCCSSKTKKKKKNVKEDKEDSSITPVSSNLENGDNNNKNHANDDDDDDDAAAHDAISPSASTTVASSVVEFTVSGMTCSMCTQAITRALEHREGVERVVVSLSTNQAVVEFDGALQSVEELREAIEDIGYDVVDTADFGAEENNNDHVENGHGHGAGPTAISTMMTPDRLDRMLQQQQKEVDFRKRAFVWSLVGTLPILIMTMVLPHLPSNKVVSWLQQTVVIFGSKFVLEALILWALATPIQFGCGYPFYKSSYHGLRQGIMGMDVLIAVGTSASYGYALWATIAGSMEYHFFETSSVLICFVLLGKWMQTLAVRRTSQALTHLLQLQPRTAIKVIPPAGSKNWNPLNNDRYTEEHVDISTIQTGDFVKILKGASIPADGIIRFGEMSVDESMITGESIPVLKTKGAVVLGGTICSEAGQEAGACFVQVTGVGANTALSQILQLVQDAQNRQVPIQNFADTISGYFVPAVVLLSVFTFMVWYALVQTGIVPPSLIPNGESPATFSLLFAIACLVCSCPCALGLATPTAVMVGTGVGAKQGVLMKGGETLELASKVNAIVFDKTGTLTRGKPAITDFSMVVSDEVFWKQILERDRSALNGSNDLPFRDTVECVLWLLASLERNSEHLLATAIVNYAEQNLKVKTGGKTDGDAENSEISYAQPTNFVAMTGRGASGKLMGNIVVSVGNRAFCESQGFPINQEVEDTMQRLERHGKTAIVAAVNRSIVVVMGVADELKPDASESVRYLKEQLGIDVWMVTGDNRRTARAISRQLRLPGNRVIAEALPVAKVEKVQELREQGFTVAMVGDGVNDSPALVEADVGLSMGTGAEIAAEASDMVLVRGNVADVCTALDLSRVIFNRIKLNFLWSLLYNCLTIPLAAGVFYPLVHTRLPPTVAALAMALSSISVVSSSLSLRLYSPPDVSMARSSLPLSRQQRQRTRIEHTRTRRGSPSVDNNETETEGDQMESSLQEPLLPRRRSTQRAGNLSCMEEGEALSE